MISDKDMDKDEKEKNFVVNDNILQFYPLFNSFSFLYIF